VADRAIIFIDGNNWYHALRDVGIEDLGRFNYKTLSERLVGPRVWVGTRYYIGRVPQDMSPVLYADQRRFLAALEATDPRITAHLGRLEPRTVESPAARELLRYLANLKTPIDRAVYQQLMAIGLAHRRQQVRVEKAVDVRLAVDMVVMAERNEFDAAYLLSADGDFTPAATAVRALNKKVYAASPEPGAELAASVNSYIRLTKDWLSGCH
jgi:uncharacterized LabA/DUF88 family protein